jgi:hypothetical protein
MNCNLINGLLFCNCDIGFELKSSNNMSHLQICEDIDECERDQFICGSDNSVCRNHIGSYLCECSPGYIAQYENTFKCEDLDECSSQCTNDCDRAYGVCINLPGTFECTCTNGFSGNGRKCSDINECNNNGSIVESARKCSPHAQCLNTIGSYECECEHGFSGNGFHCEGWRHQGPKPRLNF